MSSSEPAPEHAPEPPSGPEVVDVDVRALKRCDVGTVDALARFALVARREGRSIRLVNAPPELVELVALSGLTRVLPSSFDPRRR
ncbi:MAG TPA: STAS domain-containing protein [Candidatus Limnocylindrales bacterium]